MHLGYVIDYLKYNPFRLSGVTVVKWKRAGSTRMLMGRNLAALAIFSDLIKENFLPVTEQY